jgi:hypothetical protein
MKASPELFARIKAAIEPHDTEATRQDYRDGEFPRSYTVKDLDTRYRWDLFYGTEAWRQIWERDGQLNGDHIDTMLRKIVPPLNNDTKAS